MKINYEDFSEPGNRSGVNQDTAGQFVNGDCGLFFVADGMGGYAGGERASGAVKKACESWWERHRQQPAADFLMLVKSLKQVLSQTSREIWEATDAETICGTTVVLLLIYKGQYGMIWSGDSRCYVVSKKLWQTPVRLLTRDDTWENQPEIIDKHSVHEIARHKNNGKLIRALGVSEHFSCTLQTGVLPRKCLFVLCSDGVYKYIPSDIFEASLKQIMASGQLAAGNAGLRQLVYKNGAPDNLSCILVQVDLGTKNR